MGGLKLLNVRFKDFALKIQWISHYKENHKIANLANYFLPIIEQDFWRCHLSVKDIQKALPESFWKDVALAWAHVNFHQPKTRVQVFKEFLWFNSNLKIQGKFPFYPQVWKKGCRLVEDIWDSQVGSFFTYEQFTQRFGNSMPWLIYRGLLSTIPNKWKIYIRDDIVDLEIDPGYELLLDTLPKKCTSMIYKGLIQSEDQMKPVYRKWCEKLEDGRPQYDEFLKCFQNLYYLTPSPKYRSFQFRLLHRKIFLNKILKIWGLSDMDLCEYCRLDYETIEHFFVECTYTARFWTAFSSWFECLTDTEITLTKTGILLNNYENINYCDSLNMFILLAKQFMFAQHCLGRDEIGFYTFKEKLQEIMKMEFQDAKFKNTRAGNRRFLKRWGVLM